jgi:ABC-type Mn2+/Zn2+ transport system permease subunit
MNEALALYWPTLLALLLAGPALSLTGSHLAARNLSLQSLVIGQASTVGIILGLILQGLAPEPSAVQDLIPTSMSLLLGLGGSAVLFSRPVRGGSSRTTLYLACFVILMGIGAFLTSVAPALDSHMVVAFFGDVATATTLDVTVIGVVSLFSIGLHYHFRRAWLEISFWTAIFQHLGSQHRHRLFNLMAIVLIALSIQAFGLMLTLSFLFIPTALISRSVSSPRSHLILGAAFAGLAGAGGLLFSLAFPGLSTSPLIVLILSALAVLPGLGKRS